MKESWSKTEKIEQTCVICNSQFLSKKKTAKYCSNLCMSRSRPKRVYDSDANTRRRLKRLENPGYREKINEQARNRKSKINEMLRDYKLSTGCRSCGFNKHHVALEFHHVNGEDKEINLALAKSIGQAMKEMEKCIVLCSNCHRITHWDENNKVEE